MAHHSPERTAQQKLALEARATGANYRAIAEMMKVATTTAYELVQEALTATIKEAAGEVRQLELDRLDKMLTAILPRCLNANDKGQARCQEIAVKLMERRAQYLGLDAPQRRIVEVVTEDELTRTLRDLEAELSQMESNGMEEGELVE